MFRSTTASLCTYCQRMRRVFSPPPAGAPPASTSTALNNNQRPENRVTVDSLNELSVDVCKVRKSKGRWVLSENSTYVFETADLLRDMGADAASIARVLETHPEAVLCRPHEVAAQRDLWASVCRDTRELVNIVEKFPASFFALAHHDNQRANIRYLRSLRLGRTVIGRLMASTPQSFSRPVERNQEVLHTLRETYLDLGGDEGNLHVWLRTLLGQNPHVLARPAEAWRDSLGFLREQGFTTEELLDLISNLSRASSCVAELQPETMRRALGYLEGALVCSKEELREIAVRCPAVLYYSLATLVGRLQGLMDVGVTTEQVKEAPCVLELATQVVLYRIRKLALCGYDVRGGGLDVVVGTREDFERSYGELHLMQQWPLVCSHDGAPPLRDEF